MPPEESGSLMSDGSAMLYSNFVLQFKKISFGLCQIIIVAGSYVHVCCRPQWGV